MIWDRWKFNFDESKSHFVATPQIEKISEFIVRASHDLTRRINEEEERLIVSAMNIPEIKRLMKICQRELKLRNEK